MDDSQRILLTRQSVRDLDIALDQVLDEQHGSDSTEPIYRHSWPAMRDIERLYRRGVDDLELTKSEDDDLAARLEAAKATIPSKWPDNVASVVRDYVDAMRTTLLSRAAGEPRISEYRDAARRLESPLSPV